MAAAAAGLAHPLSSRPARSLRRSALPPSHAATLGLDFGTSGVRAVVVDSAGCTLASAREGWPAGAESDWPAAWAAGLAATLHALPSEARARVGALAIDGTSATALLVDSRSGETLAPPLLYNHAVPGAAALLAAQGVPEQHAAFSASGTAAKLLWWRSQGRLSDGALLEHQADYVAALLTGQRGRSDWNNALKLGFDPQALRWPDWLAGDAELAAALPRSVHPPGASLGRVCAAQAAALGLPPACLVAAGTTDSVAAFLAAAGCEALQPGDAVTSLGSTLAVKLLSAARVEQAACGVYSHRLPDGEWLVGGASNSGGAVLRSVFGVDSDVVLAQLSARIDPGQPSPLRLYPLLRRGERFPVADAEKEPVMGPRPEDDAAYLHALLEGMAEIEADGYAALSRLGAPPLRRVFTAGGGARNDVWTAIRARRLGVPVLPSAQGEAAYGAALLARRALQ